MELKPYLTTIFRLIGWILNGLVPKVFVIEYLVEHRGLLVERTPTIK